MCMYAHAISPAQGVLLIESVLVQFLYMHVQYLMLWSLEVESRKGTSLPGPVVLMNMAVVCSGHLDLISCACVGKGVLLHVYVHIHVHVHVHVMHIVHVHVQYFP